MPRIAAHVEARRPDDRPATRYGRETPDEVVGEAEIGHLLSEDGFVRVGTLVMLAEDLSDRGARLNSAGAFAATEAKASLFGPSRDDVLVGRSVPLHVGTDSMVWQTMVRNRDGDAVGVVMQTYLPAAGRTAPVSQPVPQRLPLAAAPAPSVTAAARMEAILAAGSRVIAERGFANATTKEIAAAAGMTAPTMYQYVRSKDELLFLICDSCFRELSARVDEAVSTCDDPTGRLRAAMAALVEASEPRRAEVRLLTRETPSLPPALREKVHRRWNEFLARFSVIVADGSAAGVFRPIDPDLASHLIEALCDVWALRRVVLRRHGLAKSKAEILEVILRGFAPSRDRRGLPAAGGDAVAGSWPDTVNGEE